MKHAVRPPALDGGAAPVDLSGSAYDRGRAQAARCPRTADAVHDAVRRRLAAVQDTPLRAADFVARQWDYAAAHDPDSVAEVEGIAAGYGLAAGDVFASLYAGLLQRPAALPGPAHDGCSAWALEHREFGALLGKNRDQPAAFLGVQRVFRHRDPAWNGRTVLCVGSLGSPGAYSSGINSDGLAVADTQIRTTDQGIGLVRYFAMTRVLVRCVTVEEALEELRSLRHAGGGSLVLADAAGATAAVELGHRTVAVERGAADSEGAPARVARTNHFVSAELRALDADGAGRHDSGPRLRRLAVWLDGLDGAPGIEAAASIMASHDGMETCGLCRHGGDRGSTTISASVYACLGARLYFSAGNPCSGSWSVYACAEQRTDGGAS